MGDALYEAALDKVVRMTEADPLTRISLPYRFAERHTLSQHWFWQCVDISVNTKRSRGGQSMEKIETQTALHQWCRANLSSRFEITPAGVEFYTVDDAMLFYMRFK